MTRLRHILEMIVAAILIFGGGAVILTLCVISRPIGWLIEREQQWEIAAAQRRLSAKTNESCHL